MLVTKEKLVEAARKNGLPHSRSGWFEFAGGPIPKKNAYEVIEACVLGQAAINLGIHHFELASALGRIYGVRNSTLYDNIVTINDKTETPYNTICDFIEANLPDDFQFEGVLFEYGATNPFARTFPLKGTTYRTAPKLD